ncbi:MAG: hypothetical protein ACRCYO_08390 [Bacteroidia bacterium]
MFLHSVIVAQTVSKWEWNITSTIHPPSSIKQTSGTDKIQIRPSAGWEFGFSREIYSKNSLKIDLGFNRGSTPMYLYFKLSKDQYPVLNMTDVYSFYYVQHPYNSYYIRFRKSIKSTNFLGIELANRVYPQSGAGTGAVEQNALTGSQLIVFKARTQTNNKRLLSPHLKLSFTGTIWKRFPSFLYEASLCYAPISVLDGRFVLFPDEANYTSSGTFRVQQSYLGLGIKYRRVKKGT